MNICVQRDRLQGKENPIFLVSSIFALSLGYPFLSLLCLNHQLSKPKQNSYILQGPLTMKILLMVAL